MKRIDAAEAAEAFELALYAGRYALEREPLKPDFASGQDLVNAAYIKSFAHSHALSVLERR